MSSRTDVLSVAALALIMGACGPRPDPESEFPEMEDLPITEPTQVAVAEGFATPESALWDADQRVWFISNINGGPSEKANNGFISRVNADGTVENLQWVQGGRDGVTLHAPKGMTLAGDHLWVADIDAVRAFDRRTGEPVSTVELGTQATFLNGITTGPDDALYVTDTGVQFGPDGMTQPGTSRIYKVEDGSAEILAEGDHLEGPNGIIWDDANDRLIMVSFTGESLTSLDAEGETTSLGTGPGGHDGVEILEDGRIIVSDWESGSIFVVGENGSGNTVLISGLDAPADIGLDPERNMIAIPLFNQNRVEFWRVPERTEMAGYR